MFMCDILVCYNISIACKHTHTHAHQSRRVDTDWHIMTQWNANIFRVTAPLRGETMGHYHKWPVTRTFDVPLLLLWTNG